MKIQETYWKAVKEFEGKVRERLGGSIDAFVVYGSLAKGEASKDSDIDVLILGERIEEFVDTISEIRYDIDLKYSVMITIVYYTPGELRGNIRKDSPFLREVLSQGVVLYGREKLGRYYQEAARAV